MNSLEKKYGFRAIAGRSHRPLIIGGVPRRNKLILASHIPITGRPSVEPNSITLEDIKEDFLAGACPDPDARRIQEQAGAISYDSIFQWLLGHCWNVVVFLNTMTESVIRPDFVERTLRGAKSDNEFDIAEFLVARSPTFFSCAAVASWLPFHYTAVELSRAIDDSIDRQHETGAADRHYANQVFSPGWQNRVSPLGIPLQTLASHLTLELVEQFRQLGVHGLDRARENEVLKHLSELTFNSGDQVGKSCTEAILAAAVSVVGNLEHSLGRSFLDKPNNEPVSRDSKSVQDRWRSVLDALGFALPCMDHHKAASLIASVQAERRAHVLALRDSRKRKERKRLLAAGRTVVTPKEHIPAVKHSEAEQRIINVLAANGRRMTTEQIIASLENRHGAASEGTTKSNLAVLVRYGVIDNRQDVDPPGYGLPESK